MIGGRMIVQDRRLTTVDVAALARESRPRASGSPASTRRGKTSTSGWR